MNANELAKTALDKLDKDYAELKRLYWKYRLATLLNIIGDIALDEGVSMRRLGMAYEKYARACRAQLGETQ